MPVLESADGLWMLAANSAGMGEAVDEWLSNQTSNALVMFAGPAEIAAYVKANTTRRGCASLREPRASWRFESHMEEVLARTPKP